ncbi:MAG: hypothetical protein ABSE16_15890 [Verrucomicrobiota bacterium]|jgi:hypothetical protein
MYPNAGRADLPVRLRHIAADAKLIGALKQRWIAAQVAKARFGAAPLPENVTSLPQQAITAIK